LNCFHQTSENINTLKSETEAEIFRIFVNEQSRQQVLMCLESYSEAANEFKAILNVNIHFISKLQIANFNFFVNSPEISRATCWFVRTYHGCTHQATETNQLRS
jgi:hypothetical protein